MPLFKRKGDRVNALKGGSSGTGLLSRVASNGGLVSAPCSELDLTVRHSQPAINLAEAEANFDSHLTLRTKSRLSKTLHEILQDNGALAYFIQFMEEQGIKALIKFWLEAESFHSSALLRVCSPNAQTGCLKQSNNSTMCQDPQVASVPRHSSGSKSPDREEKSKGDGGCSRAVPMHQSIFQKDSNEPSSPNVSSNRSPEKMATGGHECSEVAQCDRDPRTCFTYNSASVNSVNTNSFSRTTETANCVVGSKLTTDQSASPHWENAKDETVIRRRDSLEQDASHIYCKYIAQDAPHPIGLTEEIRSHISDAISQEPISPDCFVPAQKIVYHRMEHEHFPLFLRSPFNYKHQVDVLTSGTVSLADVLYNDSAIFYFMEFMEQELTRHLVDFLLMADNFRNQLLSQGQYDGLQAQEDAMVIYDKYFSLQAAKPLGFSDSIRSEVEQNICREDGPLPSCFSKPVMILMQHLERHYLPMFLSSQLYVKYISECIVTIQAAQSNTDLLTGKRRAGSDSSSSDMSFTSHTINTLLAMDGKQPGSGNKRILKNIGDSDMKIDTGQFNPDALWRRNLSGKLQMAHVDGLGKVTTEFEPEPDRKITSNFSKALKKLVNWDVDKSEEDMAWQVAEMIVRDVCSVTLGSDSESTTEYDS